MLWTLVLLALGASCGAHGEWARPRGPGSGRGSPAGRGLDNVTSVCGPGV